MANTEQTFWPMQCFWFKKLGTQMQWWTRISLKNLRITFNIYFSPFLFKVVILWVLHYSLHKITRKRILQPWNVEEFICQERLKNISAEKSWRIYRSGKAEEYIGRERLKNISVEKGWISSTEIVSGIWKKSTLLPKSFDFNKRRRGDICEPGTNRLDQ